MPPDVFFALASSGITLVASLLFFVSDDRPPRQIAVGPALDFCLPPVRAGNVRPAPPPLPVTPECLVAVSTPALQGTMTFRPSGDEWSITWESVPLADSPAVSLEGGEIGGAVHDLRWSGRAGMLRPTHQTWKQKPGRA